MGQHPTAVGDTVLVRSAASALLAEFLCLTFGLQSVGVEMHPLLALGAAHQEPGHSFSREESIGLCNLGKQRDGCLSWARNGEGRAGRGAHGYPPTSPAQPSQEHQRRTATHRSLQPSPGIPAALPPEQLLLEEHSGSVTGVSGRHREAQGQTFGLPAQPLLPRNSFPLPLGVWEEQSYKHVRIKRESKVSSALFALLITITPVTWRIH